MISDSDITGNRAKRSPVFPGHEPNRVSEDANDIITSSEVEDNIISKDQGVEDLRHLTKRSPICKRSASPCIIKKSKKKFKKFVVKSMKNLPVQPAPGVSGSRGAELAIFFATSNFDLKYFCNLLTLRMYSTSFERPDSYLFED